jgi:uncharacterized protein
MNKIFALCFIACMISSQVLADTRTHYRAAEECLLAMRTKENIEQSIDEQLKYQIKNQPGLVEYKVILKRFLLKYMGWTSMKNDLIRLYVEAFSESELRDLIKFYRTSIGQKMLQQQSVLAQKGALIGTKKVNDHLEELTSMVKAEAARIEQR